MAASSGGKRGRPFAGNMCFRFQRLLASIAAESVCHAKVAPPPPPQQQQQQYRCRRRCRRHESIAFTFVALAIAAISCFATSAHAFMQASPVGGLSVLGSGGKAAAGLTQHLHHYKQLQQNGRPSPFSLTEKTGRTRSPLRMASGAIPQQGEARGRRGAVRARLGAILRGVGGDTKLERIKHMASRWLRAAKCSASKRALTVALAVTLLFPSLNTPRYAEGGGSVAPGAGHNAPAVELVLPSESAAAERALPAGRGGSASSGEGILRSASAASQQRVGVGGGRAAPSSSAFVRPMGEGSGGSAAVQPNGVVATAIKLPFRKSQAKKVEPIKETPTEALRSLVTTVSENGREIAEEFSGHIKGAKRDVLVILLANALIIPLCKRVGLSPVLGFLAAGVVLGPNCLSVVSDVKAIEVLGEMGIVFFLFEMGLELSVSRLMAMKRDVFGLGLATFGVSAAAVAGMGYFAGLTGAQMVVIGGGVALSSSAFVLQLLRDRDDLGTRYGRACFGILLFQDLAVVPLLVAIPLLAGGGGGLAAALTSAATKAAIALGLIAFIGKNVLSRFFLLVAKSKSQEAFLAVMLLTVISLSSITEGLGLSGTLGAFLAGTLLSETKYTPQVEADIAPFRALLLGMFFMTVGFEIDLVLCFNNLPLVASLVSGLLAMKAAVIAIIALAFGLSVANAQQTGLLLSQGGEFAFVAFGMAERLGIIEPQLCKLLLTTVAISMAATPALSTFSAWVADQMEKRMGYDHYVGGDSESDEIRQGDGFVVVCGYGRIGRLVCELLGKKFINFVAFDNNPLKAMEARNRGLPVFYGDVYRPEVLNAFNVGKARAVICTLSDVKGTNKAVSNLRREFPDLPIFARAKDIKHQKRLSTVTDVVAMVPTLPEDSIIVSLPFGGAVLRSLGCTAEEVNVLLEDTRKKFVMEKGLESEEENNLFEQLGISRLPESTDTDEDDDNTPMDDDVTEGSGGSSSSSSSSVSEVDRRDASTATASTAAAVAAATVAGVVAEAAGVSPESVVTAAAVSGPSPLDDNDEDDNGFDDDNAGVVDAEISGEVLAVASALEEEGSPSALAAAAALEAAVASGDVVYPTNASKDAIEEESGGEEEGDGVDESEQELTAPSEVM